MSTPNAVAALKAAREFQLMVRDAEARRDGFAWIARKGGATYPEIGLAIGLSSSGARDLVNRVRKEIES